MFLGMSFQGVSFVFNSWDHSVPIVHRRHSVIAYLFNVQGNNAKAIKALQADPVKSDPDSFGVQVSFQDIKHALDQRNTTVDASIKAIYVELLQGQLKMYT